MGKTKYKTTEAEYIKLCIIYKSNNYSNFHTFHDAVTSNRLELNDDCYKWIKDGSINLASKTQRFHRNTKKHLDKTIEQLQQSLLTPREHFGKDKNWEMMILSKMTESGITDDQIVNVFDKTIQNRISKMNSLVKYVEKIIGEMEEIKNQDNTKYSSPRWIKSMLLRRRDYILRRRKNPEPEQKITQQQHCGTTSINEQCQQSSALQYNQQSSFLENNFNTTPIAQQIQQPLHQQYQYDHSNNIILHPFVQHHQYQNATHAQPMNSLFMHQEYMDKIFECEQRLQEQIQVSNEQIQMLEERINIQDEVIANLTQRLNDIENYQQGGSDIDHKDECVTDIDVCNINDIVGGDRDKNDGVNNESDNVTTDIDVERCSNKSTHNDSNDIVGGDKDENDGVNNENDNVITIMDVERCSNKSTHNEGQAHNDIVRSPKKRLRRMKQQLPTSTGPKRKVQVFDLTNISDKGTVEENKRQCIDLTIPIPRKKHVGTTNSQEKIQQRIDLSTQNTQPVILMFPFEFKGSIENIYDIEKYLTDDIAEMFPLEDGNHKEKYERVGSISKIRYDDIKRLREVEMDSEKDKESNMDRAKSIITSKRGGHRSRSNPKELYMNDELINFWMKW